MQSTATITVATPEPLAGRLDHAASGGYDRGEQSEPVTWNRDDLIVAGLVREATMPDQWRETMADESGRYNTGADPVRILEVSIPPQVAALMPFLPTDDAGRVRAAAGVHEIVEAIRHGEACQYVDPMSVRQSAA